VNNRRWRNRRVPLESLEHDTLEMLDEILDRLERLEAAVQDVKEKVEELAKPRRGPP